MLFNAKSLKPFFSQKKGAIYSLFLLIAVAAIVIGILSVSGAKFSTTPSQQFTPRWVMASAVNASLNITITNDASSPAAIKRVDITKPTGVGNIECGTNIPTGWTCVRGSNDVFIKFTNSDGLAAGSAAGFNINITPPAGAGNQTFAIDTFENTGGSININSTNINVSVDANPPTIKLMNISTSLTNSAGVAFAKNISAAADFTNLVHIFLPNASGITVVVEAIDNGSEVANVTLVYNYTLDTTAVPAQVPVRDKSGNITVNMTNQSFGSASLFGFTFPLATFVNGTKVVFSIAANDTVGNFNVSNATPTVGWNFTIDSAAPRFEDVQILNWSQLTTNTAGNAINTTKTFGSLAGLEYIINSSLLLNVSAIVSDGGGSGVVRVQVMNRSGNFMDMNLVTGTNNGSSGQTVWNLTADARNITDMAQRVGGFNGDGLYNISFRITDNVSNVVNNNFTVEVDDTPPTGSVTTNITINGNLSEGNVTLDLNTLNVSGFNINLTTSSNINNVTRNVSVFGNKGLVFNLTYLSGSGTPSGTSTWNLTVQNATLNNLSNFCDASTGFTAADGSQCNLRFNFSDVLGRDNSTINLTIAVDGAAPNVSIISPVSLTTNYTTTVLINASVNDSVGPLRNVSFRWRNSTAPNDNTEGGNVSNWMPMTLYAGTNRQFNAKGYWNATLTISGLIDGNFSVEVNATDSGARQNATANVTNVIFDSSIPQNITVVAPGSNSFHRVNFTVGINATERVSGLLNVSVRLENGTFNSSWVEMRQEIVALSSVTAGGITVKYNASRFNMTHVAEQNINATNGNFTLRLNVTDTAGNQNTTVTINFTIDTVLPTGLTVIQPVTGINRTGNFTVNLSATESNVASVWFRWVNDSSKTDISGRSAWFGMNNGGGANNFNATFTNFTDGSMAFIDGNYSIEFNVTDRAGNQNATTLNSSPFVQLILDNTAPLIVATGSLVGNTSNLTGNFVVNLTINDTYSWNVTLGNINTTNINASAFRLENTTFNSSWVNLPFATTDMAKANSNRTNATFTFSSVPNGLYNIRFMVNDTAGNQNNTVQVSNVMLDNVAPGVAIAASNLSPSPAGGAGISGALSFNVTITDNLPVNISIGNTNATQGNKFGVFYRFVSASVTTSWLPMNTTSFSQSTTEPHKVVFNATNGTTVLTDGDYQLQINATDSANNQNATVYVDVTVQNGGSAPAAENFTFLGGFITGSDTNRTSPTLLLNTTTNATCRYSLDTPKNNYNLMTSTMGNNVSREHRTALGFLPDRAASGYSVYYACKDVGGNYTPSSTTYLNAAFSVDSRDFFNITMGAIGSNKARGDYFATGWNGFALPKTPLLANTGAPTNYNVTNVLSSLGNSVFSATNFSIIFAYNGTGWASYDPTRSTNSFTNFTSDSPEKVYYINISVANERLEIN